MELLLLIFCLFVLFFLALGCSTGLQDRLYKLSLNMMRQSAGLKVRKVSIKDVDMTCLERPGKGPVCLLIHGFSANKDNWTVFAGKLPRDYHLVIPDLAGHGDSLAPSGGGYGLITQAGYLHELMETLNISRFHVAGNSMGGAIAMIYGALYPDQLLSLTLFDAAGVDAPKKSQFMTALDQGENLLIPHDRKSFEYFMNMVMSRPPLMPWPFRGAVMREALARETLNREIFKDMMATQAKLPDHLLEDALKEKLTMPCLIVWGEDDRVLDVSSVETFKKIMPQARTMIYPGVGHIPMLEIPKKTALHYADFVSGEKRD